MDYALIWFVKGAYRIKLQFCFNSLGALLCDIQRTSVY